MDGTLAAIFLLIGAADMGANHCPTGCLEPGFADAKWNFQASEVQFQSEAIGQEIYISYDFDQAYGPFQLTAGGSVTTDGDAWVGYGAKWNSQGVYPSPLFIETSLMPGLYARGDGPDLGSVLQFRSAFGVGYEFDHGGTLTVLYDHRSNADIVEVNPGIETLGIRYALAIN